MAYVTRRRFITALTAGIVSGTFFPWQEDAIAKTICPDFGCLRIGVIADLHMTIRGKDSLLMSSHSMRCLKKTIAALNRQTDLDLVVVAGDLLYDGEWENAIIVKENLDQLHAPYFVVAGNHDYVPVVAKRRRPDFSYLTISEFAELFQGHGFNQNGDLYWAQTIRPGLRLIGLHSCLPEKNTRGGRIPAGQLSWLQHQLSRYPNTLHVIVMHHNLIRWTSFEQHGAPAEWYCIDNDREVRDLLARHKKTASVVFSGHRHIGLRCRKVSGVQYFSLPSINSYPMRYGLFTLTSQGISWESPAVSINPDVQQQAKENLLIACETGGSWLPGDIECGQNLLDFYENMPMRSGICRLDSV